MKVERQGLRLTGALLIAAVALLSAPAAAQGGGPERPPVKAPARLGPEPAPAARTAAPAPPPPAASTITPTRSVVTTPATPAQPVVTTTASRQQRATSTGPTPRAHRRPPPAKAMRAVKAAVRTIAHGVERPGGGIALGAAPAGTNSSDRLLFVGGLALLVLVLGDTVFLAMSARAVRDDP